MDSATKHEIWVVALSTAVLEAPAVAIIALAFLARWPGPQWGRTGRRAKKADSEQRTRRATAMRLHSYMDENRSRHLDLIGGKHHPWSIDLVAVIASGILLMGFACAIAVLWVH
jgi:hypothetical protein